VLEIGEYNRGSQEAEELGKDVPEDVDMSMYMGDVMVLDV
jgi:hypothetical protein